MNPLTSTVPKHDLDCALRNPIVEDVASVWHCESALVALERRGAQARVGKNQCDCAFSACQYKFRRVRIILQDSGKSLLKRQAGARRPIKPLGAGDGHAPKQSILVPLALLHRAESFQAAWFLHPQHCLHEAATRNTRNHPEAQTSASARSIGQTPVPVDRAGAAVQGKGR